MSRRPWRPQMGEPALRLVKPLERAIGQGHPWIYSDALSGPQPEPGVVVTVLDRHAHFLARGLAEAGPIGVRVFTTRDEPLDVDLFARRLAEAVGLRERLVPPETDALRLVHGEGDRLPGVVVDRYGEHAVVRYDGTAIGAWREAVERELEVHLNRLGVTTLLRRSGRGLTKRVEPLRGDLPSEPILVREHGMRLLVDLAHGQKTGMFLDLRAARRRVRSLVAAIGAPRVANLFGYSGGFSIAAGLGGASAVTTVDVAAPALALADAGWRANELPPDRHRIVAGEVELFLRASQQFDLIVADPPSFAPNAESRERGLSAYRSLHAAALSKVAPGGFYLAASCSSHVDRPAFEDTLRKAARSIRVELQVIERGGADFDHPIPLGFPEGEYLKWTLGRVLS